MVEQYDYDAFGLPTIKDAAGKILPASTIANPTLFTGREWDSEVGLYHYRARAYDPKLGRFLQVDPLGYEDSMNLYEYVLNNPLRFTDPFGLTIGGRDGGYEPPNVPPVFFPILTPYGVMVLTGNLGGRPPPNPLIFQKGNVGKQKTAAGGKRIGVSQSKYPESAKHLKDSGTVGKLLTLDRAGANERRRQALRSTPRRPGLDRDESPPAVFREGGRGASVRYVSPRDNRGAGASIGR